MNSSAPLTDFLPLVFCAVVDKTILLKDILFVLTRYLRRLIKLSIKVSTPALSSLSRLVPGRQSKAIDISSSLKGVAYRVLYTLYIHALSSDFEVSFVTI